MSFLAEIQQVNSAHFGGEREGSLDVPYITRDEAPLIEGSLAQIVARTTAIHEAGDHLLYIGRIQHLQFGE